MVDLYTTNAPFIRCLVCQRDSYSLGDIENIYCPEHGFHRDEGVPYAIIKPLPQTENTDHHWVVCVSPSDFKNTYTCYLHLVDKRREAIQTDSVIVSDQYKDIEKIMKENQYTRLNETWLKSPSDELQIIEHWRV